MGGGGPWSTICSGRGLRPTQGDARWQLIKALQLPVAGGRNNPLLVPRENKLSFKTFCCFLMGYRGLPLICKAPRHGEQEGQGRHRPSSPW